jgi:hypothetical protein
MVAFIIICELLTNLFLGRTLFSPQTQDTPRSEAGAGTKELVNEA